MPIGNSIESADAPHQLRQAVDQQLRLTARRRDVRAAAAEPARRRSRRTCVDEPGGQRTALFALVQYRPLDLDDVEVERQLVVHDISFRPAMALLKAPPPDLAGSRTQKPQVAASSTLGAA